MFLVVSIRWKLGLSAVHSRVRSRKIVIEACLKKSYIFVQEHFTYVKNTISIDNEEPLIPHLMQCMTSVPMIQLRLDVTMPNFLILVH
jgi:hypothetical protein